MQSLLKRITNLLAQIDAAFVRLSIAAKEKTIGVLETELASSEVWHNPTDAQEIE